MLRSRRVPIRATGFIEPCLPSRARELPGGSDWLHEIKFDGYRMMVRRDGAGLRLLTRRGYDWTSRYPAIAAAAGALRATSFLNHNGSSPGSAGEAAKV
jgi:ATP-dependent DNA ligase